MRGRAGADAAGTARPGQRRAVLRSVLPTLIDIVVPVGVYFILRGFGMPSFWALVLGASVSLLTVVVGVIRSRRLDTTAVLVLVMLLVGAVVTFLTGDARILLLKPSIFFVVLGAYFLASCWFRRPLMYEFIKPVATAGDARKLRHFELTWEQVPRFRRLMRAMSAVWGVTWLVESGARATIVYSLPAARVGEALLWTVPALVVILLPGIGIIIALGRRMRQVSAEFGRRLDREGSG